jgi:hypothetical protein
MAIASKEVRRGQSAMANGIDSDIRLHPTLITTSNLAAELAKYPNVEVGTCAFNRQWVHNLTGKIMAEYDLDGKWYYEDGSEVT